MKRKCSGMGYNVGNRTKYTLRFADDQVVKRKCSGMEYNVDNTTKYTLRFADDQVVKRKCSGMGYNVVIQRNIRCDLRTIRW